MSLFAALLLALSSQVTFAQAPISAFSFSSVALSNQDSSRASLAIQDVQSWSISLSSEFVDLTEGGIFVVPLPNGESIEAEVSVRIDFDNGDTQLIAKVDDGGSIVITIGDGVAFGSINNSDVSYSIGLNSDREIALIDNQSLQGKVDLNNDMRFAPENANEAAVARTSRSYQDLASISEAMIAQSTVDLLVVYSSEFATLFGSPATRINQLISFTNTSFADSGILINLRLVGAVQLEFDNTNFESSFTQVFDELDIILDDSTNGVGDFSSLPALRNQYGADLVAVLSANTNNGGAAGLAWVLNGSENPVTGVSTTMLSSNCCDSVFAHELGHNLGSVHQIGDCNGGYTGFSCGFRDNPNGWATIMSSDGNKSVIGNLFSNTDSNCLGLTCGLAGEADNRTSFNMSRLVVAEFRDEVQPSNPTNPTNPSTPSNTETGWLPAILFNLIDDDT